MPAASARARAPLAVQPLPSHIARALPGIAPAVAAAPAIAPAGLTVCARPSGGTHAPPVFTGTMLATSARASDLDFTRPAGIASEALAVRAHIVGPAVLDARAAARASHAREASPSGGVRTWRDGAVNAAPPATAGAHAIVTAPAMGRAVGGAGAVDALHVHTRPPRHACALWLGAAGDSDAAVLEVASTSRPPALVVRTLRGLRHVAIVAAVAGGTHAPAARARPVRPAVELTRQLGARLAAPSR